MLFPFSPAFDRAGALSVMSGGLADGVHRQAIRETISHADFIAVLAFTVADEGFCFTLVAEGCNALAVGADFVFLHGVDPLSVCVPLIWYYFTISVQIYQDGKITKYIYANMCIMYIYADIFDVV